MKKDPLLRFHLYRFHPNIDAKGWWITVFICPALRLMDRPEDEGRLILSGFGFEVGLIWQTAWDRLSGQFRPRVRASCWSDADEIATRIARNVGALA